jgi:hypothetical protein
MGDREMDGGRCAVVGGLKEAMVLTKRFFREARFAGRRTDEGTTNVQGRIENMFIFFK